MELCPAFFTPRNAFLQRREESSGIQKSIIKCNKPRVNSPKTSGSLNLRRTNWFSAAPVPPFSFGTFAAAAPLSPSCATSNNAFPGPSAFSQSVFQSNSFAGFAAAPTAVQDNNIKLVNGFCVQLDCAARCGDLKAIEECILSGANLNQKSQLSNQTPVHASLQGKQLMAIQLLVTKGADIYECDASGRNCIDFAKLLQLDDAAKLMQQLSLHIFTSAIAASCRFGACAIAPMFHTQRYARSSTAALAKLKSAHTQRLMLTKTRCQAAAWSAVAGMLSFRLSIERESANAQPALRSCVHRCMMAAFSRGGPALQIANCEFAVVASK